jgi:hypothetical protein
MDFSGTIINLFNILIVLVFIFNLFNLYRIFYKKGKINTYFPNGYKTIPDTFPKRSKGNWFSLIFWSVAAVFSAYQWYLQKTTNFSDLIFSVESFTLFATSLAVLRYFDTGAFSETKTRAHIFYDEKYFTVNPFEKLLVFKKHYWEELKNFELVDSQFRSYIYIIINLKDGEKYRLLTTQQEKDIITKELTKHLSFINTAN